MTFLIGDRALAERADEVARLGRVIIRTLQQQGVAACGKHFPGHGDTSTDSHHELPLVEHEPERLRAIEFEPFRAAIAEQVVSGKVEVAKGGQLRETTVLFSDIRGFTSMSERQLRPRIDAFLVARASMS